MGGPSQPRDETHVAFLRGINVGGKNILPMAKLVALVEDLGAHDVSTFIQSGNVIFHASASLVERFADQLARGIAERFGLTVPIVLRSAHALTRTVADNPFASLDPSKLHVAFLASAPSANASASLDPERSPPDRFALRGADLYLHLPNGVGKTRYTSSYLDSRLGTTATIRNWNTVGKLVELSRSKR